MCHPKSLFLKDLSETLGITSAEGSHVTQADTSPGVTQIHYLFEAGIERPDHPAR